MPRMGLTSLILVALGVGACFELIKRLSFDAPQGDSLGVMGQTLSRPYARGEGSPLNSLKSAPALGRAAPLKRSALPLNTSRMYVPRQNEFNTHLGTANQKGTPAVAQKSDDKKETSEKKLKLCPPLLPNAVQPEPVALAESENASTDVAQSNDKKETDKYAAPGEECIEEEKVADLEPTQESDETQDEDDNQDLTADYSAQPFVAGANPVANNEPALAGFEQWKNRLLSKPDFKETVSLIEAAQSGKISMALFQQLVQAMLADNRIEIRELGVLAAGRVPSFQSFHLLVSVLKKENFGSRLRVRAEAEINIYEQLPYLSILSQVMSESTDTIAVVWAVRQLDDSAKRYLTAKYNRPRPGNPTAASGHTYSSYYRAFVALLREMTSSASDAQEASQARQTLDSIEQLLRSFS